MLQASVVSSAAHAVLAGYVAYALGHGARTRSRRDLSLSFAGLSLYSVTIGLAYATHGALATALFDACLLVALAATVKLASFATGLGGQEPQRRPRWPALVMVLALLIFADAMRRSWMARDSSSDEAALGALVLAVFVLVLVLLAIKALRATGATAQSARAFLTAAFWPVIPIGADVAHNLGLQMTWFGLVRDLCLLLFCYAMLLAYLNHGDEPMSLRFRIVSGTLTIVLAVVIGVSEVFVRHPGIPLPSSRLADVAEYQASVRALVLCGVACVLVLFVFPRFYKRSVLTPIDRLMDGVRRMEGGQWADPIAIIHDDEIGFLTAGFNRMVSGLREAQRGLAQRLDELSAKNAEVEALNAELKRQIAARSRELAEALERLEPRERRLAAGDVVDGRYRVLGLLGRGGMGAVYRVERRNDQRVLALKVMGGQTSGSAAARFAREAEIAAQLDHVNLVSVLDVGLWQGVAYLVMELVSGGSLEDRRTRFGDVAWAQTVLAQVARAVQALHSSGVVHRDLKPANVLLAEEAGGVVVKVTDFGVARQDSVDAFANTLASSGSVDAFANTLGSSEGGDPGALTATGAMIGTLHYMAPEAASGAHGVGAPADVFAFGLMGFELMNGRLPFEVPPLFRALAGKPVPDPPALPQGLPAVQREVLRACLKSAPRERPSARMLVDAFAPTLRAAPR